MMKSAKSRIPAIGLVLAAVAFLLAIAFFVFGAPRGYIGFRTAFETLRILGWLGVLGAAGSLVILVIGSRTGVSRIISAAATISFALPVAILIANAASPPPGDVINDITTDLDDPPRFAAVIPLRPAGSNPIEYGGDAVAARQRVAYPEVRPILTELTPDSAFQRAFETAEMLGWEIVSGDLQSGVIEAIDTTRFFRFKDDIVVRITEHEAGSRVDLRSRSRIGRSDLGKNAKRIQAFTDAFVASG